MDKATPSTHVAILPSPGMGHLIPLAALAKRVVQLHDLSVTLIVPTAGTPTQATKALLEALPKLVNYMFLPQVSLDDLPNDIDIETRMFLTTSRSLPSLRDSLKSLTEKTRLSALVVDLFGIDAFHVAKEFQVSPYLFFTANATNLSLAFYLPNLDEMVSCEFRDLPDPINIPGCVPVHGRDLLDPVQDRSSPIYKSLLENSKRFSLAEGVLLNSFVELEEGPIQAFQVEGSVYPPIYPIGPLIQTGSSGVGSERSTCLDWLDNQPSGSVLFISFGSGGTLSYDQLHELALGLEMSGKRFLWVVRSPNDKASNGAYFSVHSQNDPLAFLPNGFLDRTRERGLVVPSWAPQVEILSHGSTGGFLTHCGWKSILESVVTGVPFIAWPLYAEQKMNAVVLSEALKLALRPKIGENGLVRRAEVEKCVKGLMEGEEGMKIRNKMKELKDAAAKVVSDNGSSTKSLSKLANKWKNKTKTGICI